MVLRLANALLLLSALLHDVGKIPQAFQDKLHKGSGAEVLRHDLISFLILAESLWTAGDTDVEWLELLAKTPAAAARCVTSDRVIPKDSTWLKRVEHRLDRSRGVLLFSDELQELDCNRPALLTVLWLVLTHHRLPASNGPGQAIDAGNHLNTPSDETEAWLAPLSECLKPAPGGMPWHDQTWLQAVAHAAADALTALAEMKATGTAVAPAPFFWPKVAAHMLRPTLVLADHLGAQQAAKGPARSVSSNAGVVYANSYDKKHMGDPLTTHLLRVWQNADGLLRRSLDSAGFAKAALEPGHFDLDQALPREFAWQRELHLACLKAASIGPAFVAIIAETGAGKTVAGVRAAHALGGGALRLTLAFGLRSLTWQTAQSYLRDIKLSPADLTVAVGQPQTLELDVKARALQEARMEDPRPGSESSAGAVSLDAALDGTQADTGWLAGLMTPSEAARLWGDKALAMLGAPVLACTADHLVGAVSLLRGGDARLHLRLTSSDLVLDEIDAYSPADLQSIGKLVFVAGMSGRNVIVMSATLSPAIFDGLHFAWRQGMDLRAHLTQEVVTPSLVLCANTVDPQVLQPESHAHAVQSWRSYVERVCEVYAEEAVTPRRRRVEICAWTATSRGEAFQAITSIALRAHHLNAIRDPRSGKRVSIGCVRLNTTKSAWRYAEHLARSGSPNPAVRLLFVAYHAKFPRSYLGVLDAALGQLGNRKAASCAHLDFPRLRTVLDTSAEPDIAVIVCSTTLVETGRDFDFDWGICEPMSARGTVQFVGRIRRHRRGEWRHTNVFILPSPLCALEMPIDGSKGVWSRPGIEDAIPGLRLTAAVPRQLVPTAMAPASAPAWAARHRARGNCAPTTDQEYMWQTSQVLPMGLWQQRIDASVCLQDSLPYASNRIGYVEHRVQAQHLCKEDGSGNETVPDSLRCYLHSLAPLNAAHAHLTRFRGEKEQQAIFIPCGDGVDYIDPFYGSRHRCLDAVATAVPTIHALIPDLKQWASRLDDGDPHIAGCMLRTDEGGAAMTRLTFDGVLGFLVG